MTRVDEVLDDSSLSYVSDIPTGLFVHYSSFSFMWRVFFLLTLVDHYFIGLNRIFSVNFGDMTYKWVPRRFWNRGDWLDRHLWNLGMVMEEMVRIELSYISSGSCLAL